MTYQKFYSSMMVAGLVLSASCKQSETSVPSHDSANRGTGEIIFHPIGVVRSPYHEQEGTPIQPVYAGGVRGTVVVFEEYLQALEDLDGFSMIWLLYDFDRAKAWKPLVTPYRDTQERGLFATRAPARPNPIGISAVKLISIQGNEIEVEGLDILDGTPVLDIKPYVPQFDSHPGVKSGWYDHNGVDRKTADDRFVK